MIYVDKIFQTKPGRHWPYRQACHMTADTLSELHNIAGFLGLRIEWFQGRKWAHYDLTVNKQREAIRLGAVVVSRREIVRKGKVLIQ